MYIYIKGTDKGFTITSLLKEMFSEKGVGERFLSLLAQGGKIHFKTDLDLPLLPKPTLLSLCQRYFCISSQVTRTQIPSHLHLLNMMNTDKVLLPPQITGTLARQLTKYVAHSYYLKLHSFL